MSTEKLLSIQSHVVSGYVGNRAATFPLQILGYDVDVINTVQFSNHTGYGDTRGQKTSPEVITALFDGLTLNGLLHYSRVLSGYIPSAEALTVVANQLKVMRQVNPDLIYLLDPVMGDVGRGLYVSKDVVPIYTSMLALASIITPNQFETELLAGVRIRSLSTLHLALSRLHTDHSLPHITLSSLPLPVSLIQRLELPAPPSSYTSLLPEPAPPWYDAVGKGNPSDEVLVCFASSYTNGKLDTWAFALPTIRGYFSGVGDLFSAMTLAHFDGARTDHNLPPLPYAVSKALLTVQQILLRTHVFSLVQSGAQDNSQTLPANDPAFVNQSVLPSDSELDSLPPEALNGVKRKARRMRLRELRLIAERDLIVNGGEGWPGQRLQWESILDMGI